MCLHTAQMHPGSNGAGVGWLEIELARDQPRFERLCRARKTVIHYLGPWASVLTRLGHADLLSRVVVTAQQHRSNAELIGHVPYQHEVDHLVSLELGGSNAITNLWPEPYAGRWGARTKDVLENRG